MNTEITYVAQPNENTCVHACLAMATGVPIEDIIKEFGDEQGIFSQDSGCFLVRNNIWPISIPLGFREYFPFAGVYMVTVPMAFGVNHSVIVLCDCDAEIPLRILDPYAQDKLPEDSLITGLSFSATVYLRYC